MTVSVARLDAVRLTLTLNEPMLSFNDRPTQTGCT